MSQQDRTLDRYQELMQINAASHVLRAAREVGIFAELGRGQRTAQQLAETLNLECAGLDLLLDSLVSMQVVERYQDDYALAPVMQLLCRYDADLGDLQWRQLAAKVGRRDDRPDEEVGDPEVADQQPSDAEPTTDQAYLHSLAATQWVHTPAAMQAAEMLDIGGKISSAGDRDDSSGRGNEPLKILDLGCGSAVWSCAMAFRDADATVLAVDEPAALAAAQSTADSIQLSGRFETLAADPQDVALPAKRFGLALLAQRLHAASPSQRNQLLDRAIGSLAPGGRLVLIDLFRGPTKPLLSETIEALRIHVGTTQGRMLSAPEFQQALSDRGLIDIQFTFIAASRINLGMLVATKPAG